MYVCVYVDVFMCMCARVCVYSREGEDVLWMLETLGLRHMQLDSMAAVMFEPCRRRFLHWNKGSLF